MTNVESGTFDLNGKPFSTNTWVLGQATRSTSPNGAGSFIQAGDTLGPQIWTGAAGSKVSFKANSAAMNYADADVVYSNTDLGTTGAGAFVGIMGENFNAVYSGYPPRTSQFIAQNKLVPAKQLTTFNNVFSWGLVKNTDNTIEANAVFY